MQTTASIVKRLACAISPGVCKTSLPLAIKLGKLFGKPVEEMFALDEEAEG